MVRLEFDTLTLFRPAPICYFPYIINGFEGLRSTSFLCECQMPYHNVKYKSYKETIHEFEVKAL